MVIGAAAQPFGLLAGGATAGVLKMLARFAALRSVGRIGKPGLLICVPGESADLPRSLIVPENVSELLFYQRTTEAAAKDILADFRALQAARVLKKLVDVQHFIPEELVHLAMEVLGAGSQDGVDVAA